MKNKIKKALGVILIGIVALIFIGGGLYNISGAPATVEIAKGVGGIRNLIVLGTLEVVFGILFLIPRTAKRAGSGHPARRGMPGRSSREGRSVPRSRAGRAPTRHADTLGAPPHPSDAATS